MLLLDTHLHFHTLFDVKTFFNALQNNFNIIAAKKCLTNFQCAVCFTESSGANFFSKLYTNIGSKNFIEGYSLVPCRDENTLVISNDKGFSVFLIAGRQIVTRENLEVLAIGMIEEFEDGVEINEVIQSVISKGLIPILPWGFGKWTGERRRVIEDIVARNEFQPLFLGDNGNRPSFMKLPSIFNKGQVKNLHNLQGSDPLPFKKEVKKPGSFGVFLETTLDEDRPFTTLKKDLVENKVKIETYGELESPLRFLRNQVAMQLVKRLRR